MNPIKWLCEKAPGFNALSKEEREAIMHFSLLWSFFEAKALNTNATANRILALVHKWASDGCLDITLFNSSLAYFRNRYFNQGVRIQTQQTASLFFLLLSSDYAITYFTGSSGLTIFVDNLTTSQMQTQRSLLPWKHIVISKLCIMGNWFQIFVFSLIDVG